MTDPLYAGLLGEIAFVSDQVRLTGCTTDEAKQRWKDRAIVEIFADQAGCTIEEAWEHRDIMRLPEFILPAEIDTRH